MSATTKSTIVWPRMAMAGCIFCSITRDTRGVTLEHAERFNFFPASPLCCVSWVLAGDLHVIEGPEQMQEPWQGRLLPKLAFSGPQLGPLVSWSPGEAFAVTIAFYPDAMSALTGRSLGDLAGKFVPLEEALPQSIVKPCQSFVDDIRRDGAERALARVEREIETLWSSARPAGLKPAYLLSDWARGLVMRAAVAGPGRSARQIARRVRAWTGVSARDLNGLGHTEELYGKLHEAMRKGAIDWAELAADAGFADQAHMIRRMRQHTGFTPQTLRKQASSNEAFWAYRLLGHYFDKPKN